LRLLACPRGANTRCSTGRDYFAQLQAAASPARTANACKKAGRCRSGCCLPCCVNRQLAVARRDTVIDVLSRLKAAGAALDARTESGETPW